MFPGATDDNFMERRKRTQVGDNLRGARVRILRGFNFCRRSGLLRPRVAERIP
jgi:hypothetical protein